MENTIFTLEGMKIVVSEVVKNRMFSLLVSEEKQYFQFVYSKISDGSIISWTFFPYYRMANEDDIGLEQIKKALSEREAYRYYKKRVMTYAK